MKVNGIDIRKYNAKQLTVELQPPSFSINYEWITGGLLPTEFKTDIKLSHLNLQIYFRGKDRNGIIRSASEFMANFTKSCNLELDGYKGKFRGFMTSDRYKKTKVKDRYIVNVELDGFFYDDELEIAFDGVTSGSFYMVGTRATPCILEVYAKSALSDYKITGFGEDDIVVEALAAGKTLVIDGTKGLVKIDGANAFESVDMWKFPELEAGETSLTFSNAKAKVTIRYMPMWF